jgi:hypothetical protein
MEPTAEILSDIAAHGPAQRPSVRSALDIAADPEQNLLDE